MGEVLIGIVSTDLLAAAFDGSLRAWVGRCGLDYRGTLDEMLRQRGRLMVLSERGAGAVERRTQLRANKLY